MYEIVIKTIQLISREKCKIPDLIGILLNLCSSVIYLIQIITKFEKDHTQFYSTLETDDFTLETDFINLTLMSVIMYCVMCKAPELSQNEYIFVCSCFLLLSKNSGRHIYHSCLSFSNNKPLMEEFELTENDWPKVSFQSWGWIWIWSKSNTFTITLHWLYWNLNAKRTGWGCLSAREMMGSNSLSLPFSVYSALKTWGIVRKCRNRNNLEM